jgi:ketosteroid isomerase-like protein
MTNRSGNTNAPFVIDRRKAILLASGVAVSGLWSIQAAVAKSQPVVSKNSGTEDATASLERNRAIAVKFITTMKDYDGLNESLVTDDIQWWAIGRGLMDKEKFKATIGANIAKRRSIMPQLPDMTIVSTTAEGDRVAVESVGHCVLADGRPYDNNYFFLLYLRDGRVRMVREFGDSKYFYDILHGIETHSTPP